MDLGQIAWLLQSPLPEAAAQYFAKETRGLDVAVRLDVGGGKGKGICSTRAFAATELIFQEPPLVAIQHTHNKDGAWVCAHCFRFVGSVEQQLARAAAHAALHASGGSAVPDNVKASLHCLAGGASPLPCSEQVTLPPPVGCRGGCDDVVYCSKECSDAAWAQHHELLCAGGAAGQEALQEFYAHADATNDVFRLAAQVVAGTLASAHRQLESAGSFASPAHLWAALQHAWQPYSMGHKGVWWECVALPADVEDEAEFRSDLRQLAADSLELLAAALRARCPDLCATFPAVLNLRVWGSVIGMFEMNNLAVFVAGPLPRWAQLVAGRPQPQVAEPLQAAGPALAAVGGLEGILSDEEAWACEGNAFYSLQACINHSCVPNAHAYKREGDLDGSAVILALRDIQPGEEITISYTDADAPLAERMEALRDYGFECNCDKCSAERLAEEMQLG